MIHIQQVEESMVIPRKKYDKIELELMELLEERAKLKNDQAIINDQFGEVNRKIRKVMKSMGKKTKETPFGIVRVIRTKSYIWLEDRILAWYEKKGYKAPVKKVFDPAKLEKDIERGRVKQSMLEDWSEVKKGEPYVRVDARR